MAEERRPENKMGTMPEGRLLATMAVPIMISMLVQALYNMVDSMFVSHISENAFNAVGLAFPLQSLMIAVGAGTGVGMNALLSRSLGEKKQDMADRTANTAMFLAVLSWLVFAVLGTVGSRAFFQAQAAGVPEIVEMGTVYARICLGCSLGLFFQFCMERMLQATGRTTWSMATQLTGAVLNIILDPILIFGLCGLPRMGVAGAAWATVIGQVVAALMGFWFNSKKNPEVHFSLKQVRWDWPVAKEIYRVGIPSTIMQSIVSIMTFCMNKILFVFTPTATAVFGAYFKIQSFVFMPVFGLNNGMVPIIAYNFGAARLDRVKKTIRLTMITACSIMAAGFLLLEFAPAALLGIFEASDEMLAIGVPALRILALIFIPAGVDIIACSVCQAIGNPLYALISSVARQLVVLVPVAWLLAQTGILQLVWWSFPISEIVALIMAVVFLRRTMRSVEAKIG